MPSNTKPSPSFNHLKEENTKLRTENERLKAKIKTHEMKARDFTRAVDSWRKSADVSDTLRIQILNQVSVVMPLLEAWLKSKPDNTKFNYLTTAIENLKRFSRGQNL